MMFITKYKLHYHDLVNLCSLRDHLITSTGLMWLIISQHDGWKTLLTGNLGNKVTLTKHENCPCEVIKTDKKYLAR